MTYCDLGCRRRTPAQGWTGMSEHGWQVNSHAHDFEDSALDYYFALLEDPDAPMPEWMASLKGES